MALFSRLITLEYFVLTGIGSFSGYGFASPECKYLCQNGLPGTYLQNALPIILVLHTALLLIREPTSQLRQWAHAHGIHWSYYVPHCTETDRLTEQQNGLLKGQPKHQLDSTSLEGWGKVLQKAVHSSNM